MIGAGSIFIVDDNPNNLSLLAGILRNAGYEVRLANSARRALAALQAGLPELVMLDVNMPDMNGIEMCKKLKEDERTAAVPVIFLSALDDVQDKVSAFNAGAVDYVTKPFHSEEVLARVATQLGIARLRRQLEEKNRELEQRYAQLQRAWRDSDEVFSTLSDVLAGTVLDGKYRLEEKIGVGGFAAIYRGRHVELDRTVAVKILRPDPGRDRMSYLERFRNEGVSATRVNHPNAVAVLDSGITEAGIAYLVMELLEGRSLAQELEISGALPLARCASIAGAVCDALAHAHSLGILHRDIKPANVFLHRGASGEVVKVLDFGIAKLFDDARQTEALTTLGRVIGTPVYMSPERLLGKPHDERADTYSVGVLLYQLISGRLPFDLGDGTLASVVMTCVNSPPLPLRSRAPEVPPAVEDVVMAALARRSDQRPTVAELARAFAAAVRESPDPAGRVGMTVEIPR